MSRILMLEHWLPLFHLWKWNRRQNDVGGIKKENEWPAGPGNGWFVAAHGTFHYRLNFACKLSFQLVKV